MRHIFRSPTVSVFPSLKETCDSVECVALVHCHTEGSNSLFRLPSHFMQAAKFEFLLTAIFHPSSQREGMSVIVGDFHLSCSILSVR